MADSEIDSKEITITIIPLEDKVSGAKFYRVVVERLPNGRGELGGTLRQRMYTRHDLDTFLEGLQGGLALCGIYVTLPEIPIGGFKTITDLEEALKIARSPDDSIPF